MDMSVAEIEAEIQATHAEIKSAPSTLLFALYADRITKQGNFFVCPYCTNVYVGNNNLQLNTLVGAWHATVNHFDRAALHGMEKTEEELRNVLIEIAPKLSPEIFTILLDTYELLAQKVGVEVAAIVSEGELNDLRIMAIQNALETIWKENY